MTKVYPNTASEATTPAPNTGEVGDQESVLTVWRKSLLFNCKGFTVFDSKGNLIFRVDNYASGNRAEIVLMDSVGIPLHTIRRKKLSLGENWTIHEGEESRNPLFSVKKHVRLLQSKSLLHVSPCVPGGGGEVKWVYVVEGSYSGRCCEVYDRRRRRVAEIRRKEKVGGVGFGDDVFQLVVQRGELDCDKAMAIVILLEQMYGSRC